MLNKIIQTCIDKNLNFSVFSLPESNDFEIIIENPVQINKSTSGFILHPFQVNLQSPVLFIPADYHFQSTNLTTENLNSIQQIPSQINNHSSTNVIETNENEYLKNLSVAISKMKEVNIDKFVFSRIKTVEKPTQLNLTDYLKTLNKTYKSAYTYLVNHQKSGTWIGATPETLISWSGDCISTMSLAGTQPISTQKPIWKIKEIEEHNYVTNYIEKAFSNSSIDFETQPTETVKAGTVIHLRTQIKSSKQVTYKQAINLASLLHPTPAICGVPLKEARQFISEIEKHSRKYYTGYLGFIEPNKKVDFFVNLRCMQVLPNRLALYLGGGITDKSIAENEWKETVYKSQTLLNALNSKK